MALALETEALTKDYAVGFWRPRPYRALDSLSLQVERNEVFGFLGPNGAGKTTTLKLLTELIYPTSGRISVLGKPPGHPDVRRRVGYLPEAPYFYDYLSAEELLNYFAGLFGLRGAARTTRVSSLLDRVGIAGERRLPLRKFSKGMLQRVGLAQALLNEPELVFLDEPMSGLDPLGRRDVRALILELRDRGCTVFFSSHILSDAEALCSRVAIVVGGQLVTSGRLSEILAFEVSGWELVMTDLQPAALESLGSAARKVTRISEGRYTIEVGPEAEPERLVGDLRSRGGRFVSLNPVRTTLEDYFVQQVEARKTAPPAGRVMPEG
jgi:ABC-2 type transport system ATP-binding protein